jgi:hypothetical protein
MTMNISPRYIEGKINLRNIIAILGGAMSDPLSEFLNLPDKEQFKLLMDAFKRLYDNALARELEQLDTDSLTKQ